MYKRIMVAVDESFMTSQVMQAAIELAKAPVRTGDLPRDRRDAAGAARSGDDAAEQRRQDRGAHAPRRSGFSRQTGWKTARAAGIEAEIRLVESEQKHVSDMLIDAASEWQADLLVVGTHGRRGIERFFVGSVAERLVRKGQTSLLLVRGEEPDQ
jgi:nucleotide-binding universal stress UspA family protein